MEQTKRLESDLAYVRGAVRASQKNGSPTAIYFIWALIVLVGFTLTDFAPQLVGYYWSILGPLGFVASAVLGWRYSVKRGQVNRGLGHRYSLHWLGMMVTIFLIVPLGVIQAVAWEELFKIMLLIIALGYFLAGVHLERPLIWVGLLMVGGYFALFVIKGYAWTFLGLLISMSIAAAALLGRRKRVEQTDA
jgi:hypothetical protein